MLSDLLKLKNTHKWGVLILICLCVGVNGCTSSGLQKLPDPHQAQTLDLYQTKTSNPQSSEEVPVRTESPEPTRKHAPTPTPFHYQVVANDTLTGIAFQHSVEIEDLVAANPGIDPNYLTIGMTLTIPVEGIVSSALPTATAVPIQVQAPVCYPLIDGGLQCVAVVENHQEFPVENVNVMISLQPADGSGQMDRVATMPMNVLTADQIGVVSTIFSPPRPQEFITTASLYAAIPVSAEDQRYLKSELHHQETIISPDGRRADVKGMVEILPEGSAPGLVWVTALAFDNQNTIVGFRKWSGDVGSISGNQAEFKLAVYSLGPPINQVELFSEARP